MQIQQYVKTKEGQIYRVNDPDSWKDCELLTKKEGERLYREQALETLRKLLKPGDTVYTILRHVSKSGMSRHIDLVVISEGRPRNISFFAATAMRDSQAKDGSIKVNGCGMDMGFHLVYNLGYYLWPEGTQKPHGSRNGEPDSSGGYALKQEWL